MKVGDKISHYLLEEKVGEGGFGDVFRAQDTNTGMEVAVKCSRPDAAESKVSDREQRFLREVSVISKVRHPGIVQLFDYGIHEDGTFFLVMEYVCGLNLEVLIARDAPFSYTYASEIILQVLDALSEAHHQGIVHRDLKPANIMLVRQGLRTDVVKLCDFGIAKAFNGSEPDLTRQNFTSAVGFGTPQYMPPEQFYGKKVGPHSDLYAVGLVFFELLTGKQACGGTSLSEVIEKQIKKFPEIPPPFNEGPLMAIFKRSLAKKISERYSNAAEMYYDIDEITRYHSQYLEKYTSVSASKRAYIQFDEPTFVGSKSNKIKFGNIDEDEIPTFDTSSFGNVDISNSNTMLFAGEPTAVDAKAPGEETVTNALSMEPTSVKAAPEGVVFGDDYDEFGPTDDMSRVDPAVAMQAALNPGSVDNKKGIKLPSFPPKKAPPSLPPKPSARSLQSVPPVPKPPVPAGLPSYPKPSKEPATVAKPEETVAIANYPKPGGTAAAVKQEETVALASYPKPSDEPFKNAGDEPTNLLDPISEEMQIATRALQQPEFVLNKKPSLNSIIFNEEPDISGMQTAINHTAMSDEEGYDEDDDLPPIFHEQPTKFFNENNPAGDPRTEDLPPVFHEQRTHFIGKKNNPNNDVGFIGMFVNSSFYRTCRHASHRFSVFVDNLYDRHFPELVTIVCLFFIILLALVIRILFF